jgi:hypothetical protein
VCDVLRAVVAVGWAIGYGKTQLCTFGVEMRGFLGLCGLVAVLTGCGEVDPVYTESPAGTVTAERVAQWDEAYAWGDHAAAGYAKASELAGYLTAAALTGYATTSDLAGFLTTESDPEFTASAASSLTEDDFVAWDEAYAWGDHAEAGYLTAGGDITASSYRIASGEFQSVTRTFHGSFSEGVGASVTHPVITGLGTHRSARVTVEFFAYDINSNTNQRAQRVHYLFNRSWDGPIVRVELGTDFDHTAGNAISVQAVASGNDIALEIEQTDGYDATTTYLATITTTYVP